MSRPLRIEYENAFYHVMNRGRGRQQVFRDVVYYEAFLDCLKEAHARFGMQVHAYCLMGNHYHLLISTPRGNLSRVMRHVNGVYTQRHNSLRRTDGPLFRGRYKAILVDASSYLLQLSRYIHRNPIEIHKPLVQKLDDYPWSSYLAYVGKVKSPDWLIREAVCGELGTARCKTAYKNYINQDIDDETVRFYQNKRQPSIWGDKYFAESAIAKASNWDQEVTRKGVVEVVSMKDIVSRVAEFFGCSERSIYQAQRGRGSKNIPRWIAMKLCQDYSGQTLQEIGRLFGVGNYCTVSQTIARLKLLTIEDKRVGEQIITISTDLTP
ncbi:MAG: transposase [Candidatus Thiodiazotropha endolucinida]|nr:transposase [Candidatus Thiodiazotropha endolucinida]MCW4289600.1 transposase [Candidatus Thiodiazotropha endolucinida]MCW4294101.1 transposase [Candidatus Thiodiazotropha endolucinida]MCW4342128.1 transposase [Candidatus Thiodiazotropha endolucinida]MCW4348036.1 transposase [Candidatus Thiodiazotropha endolucinida]